MKSTYTNNQKFKKTILVVTYGRSGSTLLMKILNSIPSADIKGENSNVLFPLYQSYQCVKEALDKKDEDSALVDHPWYGVDDINLETYLQALRNIFINEILKPKENVRVIGFKEIRYASIPNRQELNKFIFFMKKFFGNEVYILFNKRNLEDVSNSGWWKNHSKKDVFKQLKPFDDWMMNFHKRYPKFTYLLDYDQYKNNPLYFKDVFKFLGEEFNQDKIEEIMNKQLIHLQPSSKID